MGRGREEDSTPAPGWSRHKGSRRTRRAVLEGSKEGAQPATQPRKDSGWLDPRTESDSGRARYGHLAHSSARPSKSRRRQLRELPFEAFALTVDLTAAELRFELADASPLTYVSYERVIRLHISKQLGSIQLQQLRGARIERFYRELVTGGLKPTTVRTVRAILSKALSDATEERWGPMLARNPARGIEAPKGEARRFTTWSKREARMFEEHVRTDRLYALWVLALTTGARRGELLGLTWRDSDLEAGRIAIAQQVRPDRKGGPVIAEPKTKKSAHSITLDATVLGRCGRTGTHRSSNAPCSAATTRTRTSSSAGRTAGCSSQAGSRSDSRSSLRTRAYRRYGYTIFATLRRRCCLPLVSPRRSYQNGSDIAAPRSRRTSTSTSPRSSSWTPPRLALPSSATARFAARFQLVSKRAAKRLG